MNVLVTGGAGYIGSHTVLALLEAGHAVTVVDNLCNSSRESLRRVEKLTGKPVAFHEVDVLDKAALTRVTTGAGFDAVIHFAALKSVNESVSQPLRYYHNNITGTLMLCEVMREQGIDRIVFSSSATVYGDAERMPVQEDFPLGAINPYGHTKLMMEQILTDVHTADPAFTVVILRYFNPAGAHPSGDIGEDPRGIPSNLVPFIAQVAAGRREKLMVYGNDYPTPDGTGVRDYIHVMDLAAGHVKALDYADRNAGRFVWNLGTGRGYSVLEMLKAFEKACGKSIPYDIAPRRPGDVATCYADPALAERQLDWKARFDIDAMCRDAWRWQSQNPQGFGG